MKPKKCKWCKTEFTPFNSLAQVCSYECSIALARSNGLKKMEQITKEKRKEMKEKNKTLGDYKKELQIKINKIVRLIDFNCKCLACGTNEGKFDASHFRGVQAWDNLRYNLFNIYSGCAQCNTYRGGNLIKFREGIVKEFGNDIINYMDDLNTIYPFIKLYKSSSRQWNSFIDTIFRKEKSLFRK